MPFVYEDTQYVRKRGSRREVLDGICYCTSGGLLAEHLEDRNGKIISKKRSAMGRERYAEKNPFKVEEKQEEQEVKEVKPKRKRKVTISSEPVLVRVPIGRRKRNQGRRRRK